MAIRFDLNRRGVDRLGETAAMGRAMNDIAAEIAEEMERGAPAMVRNNGMFYSDTDGDGGALAAVKSPFWHWAEFGTAGRHFRTPQPFIRPAAQSIISRYRGRWKPQ